MIKHQYVAGAREGLLEAVTQPRIPDGALRMTRAVQQGVCMGEVDKSKTSSQGNEHAAPRRVPFQGPSRPISGALIDLEWARVYAGGIQAELKLIATAIADLNLHVSNPELIRGAALLRTQMKRASKQVGQMREVASRFEGPLGKREKRRTRQVSGRDNSVPPESKKNEPAAKNARSSGRRPVVH
jgi:hypothetical protein